MKSPWLPAVFGGALLLLTGTAQSLVIESEIHAAHSFPTKNGHLQSRGLERREGTSAETLKAGGDLLAGVEQFSKRYSELSNLNFLASNQISELVASETLVRDLIIRSHNWMKEANGILRAETTSSMGQLKSNFENLVIELRKHIVTLRAAQSEIGFLDVLHSKAQARLEGAAAAEPQRRVKEKLKLLNQRSKALKDHAMKINEMIGKGNNEEAFAGFLKTLDLSHMRVPSREGDSRATFELEVSAVTWESKLLKKYKPELQALREQIKQDMPISAQGADDSPNAGQEPNKGEVSAQSAAEQEAGESTKSNHPPKDGEGPTGSVQKAQSAAKPELRPAGDSVEYVFVADKRSHEVLKKQGGIEPFGLNDQSGDEAYSIYRHRKGKVFLWMDSATAFDDIPELETAYVTAFKTLQEALDLSDPGANIYKFRAAGNAIDLHGTLNTDEGQVVLLGGSDWRQCKGWMTAGEIKDLKKETRVEATREQLFDERINNNPNFDPTGSAAIHPGEPALAGKVEPYKGLKDEALRFAASRAEEPYHRGPFKTILRNFVCSQPGRRQRRDLCSSFAEENGLGRSETDLASPEKGKDPRPELVSSHVAEEAELLSQREFVHLAKIHGLDKIPTAWQEAGEKSVKTLAEVRNKMLGYTRLEPTSPKLDFRSGMGKTGIGLGQTGTGMSKVWMAVGGVGLGFYAYGIVDAFRTNSTALDKSAAVTAIVPFVGCLVSGVASVEKDEKESLVAISQELCLLGDALFLVNPALGLMVHVSNSAFRLLFDLPPKSPDHNVSLEIRNKIWKKVLHDNIYRYIYSHNVTSPHQAFAAKLSSVLTITGMGVCSEAAANFGALKAISMSIKESPTIHQNFSLSELESGTQQACDEIEDIAAAEIGSLQREVLFNILSNLIKNNDARFQEVNANYTNFLTSKENLERYSWSMPQHSVVVAGMTAGSDSFVPPPLEIMDRLQAANTSFQATVAFLNKTPAPMPPAVEVAFILGQSKGMAAATQDATSPQSYLKKVVRDIKKAGNITELLPNAYLDKLAIRHTVDTMKLLMGEIKEDQLSPIFPIGDAQTFLNFRILCAMAFGRYWERAKMVMEKGGKGKKGSYFSANPEEFVAPAIPPVLKLHDLDYHLKGVFGLEHLVPAAHFDGSEDAGLEQATRAIARKLEMIQTVQ